MNAPFVLYRRRETVASERLKALSEGYRVAVEARSIAADLGCSGDIYDALTALCDREAAQFEGRAD